MLSVGKMDDWRSGSPVVKMWGAGRNCDRAHIATVSAAHAGDQQLLGLQICRFDDILKLVVVAAHTLAELLGRFLQRFQSAFT